VADVAKDMRDEGTKTIRNTSAILLIGSLLIAFVNLILKQPSSTLPALPKGRVLHPSIDEAPSGAVPAAQVPLHPPVTRV